MTIQRDHFIEDIFLNSNHPDFLSETFLREFKPQAYASHESKLRAKEDLKARQAHTLRLRRQAVRLTGLVGHRVKGNHYDDRTDAQLISVITELQNFLRDHDAKPVPVAKPRKRRRPSATATQTVEA
ncbi:hypothetical protein IFU30_11045 [Plantibacter sp. CFBP 8798]|uniref:hypothetical protein n=1 Tax=Plantibacter sp. CFBP 8798 TaxID=2775268 RepID=UPI00177AD795|nr:hypothetical protein [Plantibacter sp. CFBP 8798]MBD8466804.1 hypothetical protein [Plantibacter sp. CFBP 8798]